MSTSQESTSVSLYTSDGRRLLTLGGGIGGGGVNDFVSLSYANVANGVGSASLIVRAGQIPDYWLRPDYLLAITTSDDPAAPERLEGQCRWRVVVIEEDLAKGETTLTADSSLCLLAGREVRYAAGSAQAQKTAAADDMIKAIARENLGSSATDAARQLSATVFGVAADVGAAPSLTKAFSRKNALQVCQEIAAASAAAGAPIFFDIVWTGAIYELRTYAGQRGRDRGAGSTSPLIIEDSWLRNVRIRRDYRVERTSVEAAGQGDGAARDTQIAEDASGIARSLWARTEATVSATGVTKGDTAGVLAEARRGLYEQRARLTFSATMIDTPQTRYGRDWGWGDRLTLSVRGVTYPVRVDAREVRISGGRREVSAALRVESDL
jgi:hypothetical protein